MLPERRPRSVRRYLRGSSLRRRRADDSGCPEDAEEGNPSRMCSKRMHPEHAREIVACTGRRVLHSVLRPVHVDPHYARCRKASWWGVRIGITVEQTHAGGRNQHWGCSDGRERGSPHVTASARKDAWHVQDKEEGRGLRPCEDQEPPVGLLARRVKLQKSVGDVWPRISSANALQKERQGRVNGGLARSKVGG